MQWVSFGVVRPGVEAKLYVDAGLVGGLFIGGPPGET